MLPDIILDNEVYEDIMDEARNYIAGLYSKWTDFNEHDPGITLLELFAVMKESQQFFIDQIGERTKEKFLKLLGLKRQKKRAAHSLVRFDAGKELLLLHAQKLDAGGICFETAWQKQLLDKDIRCCLSVCGERVEDYIDCDRLEYDHMLHFLPFGKGQKTGSRFYICFEKALPVHVSLDMYLEVYKGYPVDRNPLKSNDFLLLVRLEWQYYTCQGWKTVEQLTDETFGILFDGFVHFTLDEPMQENSVMGQKGYFLRVVLREGEYEVPVILNGISMNICEVVQQETLVESVLQNGEPEEGIELDTELSVTGMSEVYLRIDEVFYPAKVFEKKICGEEGKVSIVIEDSRSSQADGILVINRELSWLYKRVLGTGNGFPYQEIDLEDVQIAWESFAIMVEEPDCQGGFRIWKKVEDFATSSAEDRHYVFDSYRGVVCFGDCIHGMAPEGSIVLTECVRTFGSDGNITTGKINRFRMNEVNEIRLSNICDGFGGCDEETLEESFLRARRYLKEPECAVTAQDYERYVRQTPGLMIESCKVLHTEAVRPFVKKVEETAVYLVVKPYGWKTGSQVDKCYYRNIMGYLEQYRMLGSSVYIFFPEYVGIDIYIEVVVKPQYFQVEERVNHALSQFFEAYRKDFGATISSGKLYGFMEKQDFVLGIRSLHMDTKGSNVRKNIEGDISLSPNGIAVLKEVKASLTIG